MAVWEAIAAEFVSSLSKTITTGLSQAVSSMTNPVSMFMPNFGKSSTIPQTPPAPPTEIKDPAYAAAPEVSVYVRSLDALLTGGVGGDIDWEQTDSQKAKCGLTFIRVGLNGMLSTVKFTTASPSTKLKSVITDSTTVFFPSPGVICAKTDVQT